MSFDGQGIGGEPPPVRLESVAGRCMSLLQSRHSCIVYTDCKGSTLLVQLKNIDCSSLGSIRVWDCDDISMMNSVFLCLYFVCGVTVPPPLVLPSAARIG